MEALSKTPPSRNRRRGSKPIFPIQQMARARPKQKLSHRICTLLKSTDSVSNIAARFLKRQIDANSFCLCFWFDLWPVKQNQFVNRLPKISGLNQSVN